MSHSFFSDTLPNVLATLGTTQEAGLSAEDVRRRRVQYGENKLQEGKRAGLLLRILYQLKDPMILVLLVAAALSFFTGGGEDWLDAGIILLIVVVNTLISVSQEDSAQKALSALQTLSAPHARVIRDKEEQTVAAADLVPGDIVLLEAGDYIPADGRILWEAALQTDESAMTGESLPVHKRSGSGMPPDTPLAERKNMVIGGTVVTGGRARVVITATGMETEMGKIAGLLLNQSQSETPLQHKMKEVSKVLSLVCLGVCAIMFGVGLLQHRDMLDMFLMAVALAVAAIPEGLPAIVTIVLAMGVSRMAKHHAIIRRLPAVETLGCASVICSDKTGTLTKNQMTVLGLWCRDPSLQNRMLTLGTLCGDVRMTSGGGFVGDPTEVAICACAATEGIFKDRIERQYLRQGEAPFDSVRKRMATRHALSNGETLIAVKGAPEAVLERCTHILTAEGSRPLTEGERRHILQENSRLAGRALRVLAVAERRQKKRPKNDTPEELECDLTFVGLMGLMDPPRPEVKEAVAQCAAAGIRPVMITGDHKDTAVAIAKELSLLRQGDRAITGAELDFLPQESLESDIERFSVFARVTPEHKLRIVQAWQKKGHVVAMTGDGVNDAPALKTADIGCAMGKSGTDVAKGAADMILADDNFASVVEAARQGRGIYANIRKAIHYLLSCNIGEILTIFLATLFCLPHSPLTPVQLLWLNLVTDSLPALALGMEPVEEAVMKQKPRSRHEPLFSRAFSIRLAWQGVLVGGLTLLSYGLGFYLSGDYRVANTMAFSTLTLSQLFHAFDVRSESTSVLRLGLFSNSAMNKAFLMGLLLQLSVLLLPPLQGAFSVVPLTLGLWGVVLGLALALPIICELTKTLSRRRRLRAASNSCSHLGDSIDSCSRH